jgi:tol-pal system protein YbgF
MIFLAALFLAGGCAGPGYGPSEEWRIRTLEEKLLLFQERQLEQSERLGDIEESVDRLSLRVEKLARQGETSPPGVSAEVSNSTRQALAMYEAMFEAAEKQGEPAPEEVEEEIAEAQEPEKEKQPEPAEKPSEPEAKEQAQAKAPSEKAEVDAKKPPEAEKTAAQEKTGPKRLYDSALALIRGGKPEQGRKRMRDYLDRYPGGSLAPNAMYWIGESHYDQERYDRAILTFKEVYDSYPRHHKAAAALLKTAYSYAAMGDEENAAFYLRVLLEDYPDSAPASLAEKKLERLAG